jgi:hypothetical protein
MAHGDIRRILNDAHAGRYLVRIRAVNRSGNTIDVEGYVMAITQEGAVRVRQDDPQRGRVHELPPERILSVERVHGG